MKLGFMSAFVKASANALLELPAVNGVIDGAQRSAVQWQHRLGPYMPMHLPFVVMDSEFGPLHVLLGQCW